MKPLTLLQGCGVSAFVLFRLYGSSIAYPSDLRMHTPVPLTNFALSIIAESGADGCCFCFPRPMGGAQSQIESAAILFAGHTPGIAGKGYRYQCRREDPPIVPDRGMSGNDTGRHSSPPKLSPWRKKIVSSLTGAVLLGMGIFFFLSSCNYVISPCERPVPELCRQCSCCHRSFDEPSPHRLDII